MRINITHRLFLAMLLAAVLSVVTAVTVLQWSVSRGFLRYVTAMEKESVARLQGELEEEYSGQGGWGRLAAEPDAWRRLVRMSLPDEPPAKRGPDGIPPVRGPEAGPSPPEPRPVPLHVTRRFGQRLFLLDSRKELVAGRRDDAATLVPLARSGRVVGYLGYVPATGMGDDHQLRFLKEQRLAFGLVAAIVALVAALLSLMVARRLVRPIRSLAEATHGLAAGDFTLRVPVERNDELGQLARDFNTLALTLERNEQSRRQWVADISHELRTPLAVLRGEIEALQDGVRTLDQGAVQSLHGEVLRLSGLVDDLYQLALSDLGALTYRKGTVDLVPLLRGEAAFYEQAFRDKGITMTLALAGSVPVFADAPRLQQLFGNLLDNALRYTDAGGQVLLGVAAGDGHGTVTLEDSAPGVADGELERIFERLYRVESSRSRAAGGAGLGLAICRTIVEAHGGTITAHHSPLGGLRVQVRLPLQEGQP
jgi:two-component system sensor histidine kinase BaeS